MKPYWDCSLCQIEQKGHALRCRRCSGKLRGRDRLLFEIGDRVKLRPRASWLSCVAAGAGQILAGRWTTGIALAVLIPLAIGLVSVGWDGLSYGHLFLGGAAGFVLLVSYLDARVGPRQRRPPCQEFCPAELAIPDYVQLLLDGECEQGYELIRTRIPLVGVIGRICPHPCESVCVRGIDGEPVSINGCKRYLADLHHEWRETQTESSLDVVEVRGGALSVGIVGSGPAGLACAYYLSELGASVTVYEADEVLGGRLATTIPSYRLPPHVLVEELEGVRAAGVRFVANTPVGPGGLSVARLRDSHDALFLAVGAQRVIEAEVPGADAAVDFQELLRAAKLGKPSPLGARVVVVGGGNAAMDVCRSAVRLGAKEVHLLYRRAREQMPARAEEVAGALREGVQMHFLTDLAEVMLQDGAVCGVRVQQMQLGVPDASGRPRPLPVPGRTEVLNADAVVPALGQAVDGSVFDDPALAGLRREPDGRVWVDPTTQCTNLPAIYAGGDAVSGASTAVQAMAQGRRAALEMFAKLGAPGVPAWRLVNRLQRKPFPGHKETPQGRIREEMPERSVRTRSGSFEEVEEGFLEAGACREAGRCLQCHREL